MVFVLYLECIEPGFTFQVYSDVKLKACYKLNWHVINGLPRFYDCCNWGKVLKLLFSGTVTRKKPCNTSEIVLYLKGKEHHGKNCIWFSHAQKLELPETIRDNVSRDEERFKSQSWHESILDERKEALFHTVLAHNFYRNQGGIKAYIGGLTSETLCGGKRGTAFTS